MSRSILQTYSYEKSEDKKYVFIRIFGNDSDLLVGTFAYHKKDKTYSILNSDEKLLSSEKNQHFRFDTTTIVNRIIPMVVFHLNQQVLFDFECKSNYHAKVANEDTDE